MNTLCNSIKHYGPLIARILLAQLFIISGFGKIKAFGGTAAYMVGKGGMLYVMVYGAGPFRPRFRSLRAATCALKMSCAWPSLYFR